MPRKLLAWSLAALGLVAVCCLHGDAALHDTPDAHPDAPPVATGKAVTALYMPTFPVSIDNRPSSEDYYATEYLRPEGEKGKHAASGGFLRDRPVPRPPATDADWRLADVRREIETARAAGLTGFDLDMLSFTRRADDDVWSAQTRVLRAAEGSHDFVVTLVPDMSGPAAETPLDDLVEATAALGSSPAANRLPDGRLVVMPFAAERHDPTWWGRYMRLMKERHGVDVALVPIFVADAGPLIPRYAPVSYAVTHWGARNPQQNDPSRTDPSSATAFAHQAHAAGLQWIQPVSVQDERPAQYVFDEASGTQNLRNTWKLAQATAAQGVMILTWNDYSEGTHVAPSVRHGKVFLDIMRRYVETFRSGATPPMPRDELYVIHRTQLVASRPVHPHRLMRARAGTAPQDEAEALVRLTAPARVVLTAGTHRAVCDLPAGENECRVTLAPGRVAASIERRKQPKLSVTSPYAVTSRPYVQDLQYVAASARSGNLLAVPPQG